MTAGASAESGESSDKAESLSSGIDTIVSALDSAALESALSDDDPFAQTGGFRQTLTAIARGEMTIDFQQTADLLSRQFFSAVRQSLWRLTRLIAPALLWALLKQFSGRSSECGRIVVQLFVCVFLTQDLSDHITLAVTTVQQISAGMQGLLPMLLTMMAAVGGSAGSALMQPAVVASASAMTSLISGITVPLAVASGGIVYALPFGRWNPRAAAGGIYAAMRGVVAGHRVHGVHRRADDALGDGGGN